MAEKITSRRIVQIAAAGLDSLAVVDLWALADDGTLWVWSSGKWIEHPGLPPLVEQVFPNDVPF